MRILITVIIYIDQDLLINKTKFLLIMELNIGKGSLYIRWFILKFNLKL